MNITIWSKGAPERDLKKGTYNLFFDLPVPFPETLVKTYETTHSISVGGVTKGIQLHKISTDRDDPSKVKIKLTVLTNPIPVGLILGSLGVGVAGLMLVQFLVKIERVLTLPITYIAGLIFLFYLIRKK